MKPVLQKKNIEKQIPNLSLSLLYLGIIVLCRTVAFKRSFVPVKWVFSCNLDFPIPESTLTTQNLLEAMTVLIKVEN